MNEREVFMAALRIEDAAGRAAYLDRACAGEAALRQRVEALLAAFEQAGSFLQQPAGNPQANELFLKALELRSPQERQADPDQACAGDVALRAGVEGLCATSERAGNSLESLAPVDGATAPEAVRERPGAVIGAYKLLEQIGEGGFGVVFMAEQTRPLCRRVALKVLKPGMDTRQVVARFEAERQALAIMDHPNIARVLDGGATATGRPYFVMELVKGAPITTFCDQNQLTPRQRLELFATVCQAVQHAHQKGIIHRDLKPSNILVTVYDTTPVVKVIDFGVAKALGQKLTDKTLFTGFAQMIGTPLYMSPEQTGQSGLDVDTRSDIYSLGVLLYELLTGTTPYPKERFQRAAYDEMMRIIREEEPPRPSTRLSESKDLLPISAQRQTEPAKLTRLVRGELDWIVMKALEKDRNRRYETANGFALDVQRYLTGEPVLAAPASQWYQLRKFVRRHRGSVVAGGLILLTLLGGIAGTAWGLVQAGRQRQLAEAKKQEAVAERDAKDGALKAEQKARADETKARKQAFAALRSMTADVVERKFAQGAVLTEGDRTFLRGVIAQFDAFAEIKGEDADSREVRAEGRFRVGNIRSRLGELKEAEKDYDQALRIQKQLVADFPARPEFRQYLATSHNNRGNLLRATGRLQGAEKDYDEALSIKKQLVADFPSRLDFRHGLAKSHNNRGDLLREMGRPREAEQDFDQALSLFKQLAADFRDRPEFRLDLASCHNNRGILLRATGRLKEAEKDFDQALRIQKQLAADFPSRPDFRQQLARSHNNRGLLRGATGRLKEAEQDLDQALGISRQLVADFRSRPEYRQELARSHNNRGALLNNTGRPEEAEKDYDEALRIQKQLAADFPSRPDFRHGLATSHNNRGSLLHARGRLKEAEKDYDEALRIQKQLAADFPSDFASRPEFRQELARSHLNGGNLRSDTGRLKEAEKDYGQALRIQKQLAADFPKQSDLRNDLAVTCVNMAAFQAQQGNWAAAKLLLLEGRPHHLAALKANPRQPAYRQFYRHHLGVLTGVHAGLLEQEDAVRAAETCRDLGWDAPADAYDAARFLSQCVYIVAKHTGLDDKQRKEAVQFYGDAAMKLLRDAVSKGYKDVVHLKRDADLAPLRLREDFQKLVAELEGKGE